MTLEAAKKQCLVDIDDDDEYLEMLITAARQAAETYTRRSFVPTVWELASDYWPAEGFVLPVSPLLSVTSLKYTDSDNAEQTLAADQYKVDDYDLPATIKRSKIGEWPALYGESNGIRLRFTAGYEPEAGSPTDYASGVPQVVKQAILLHVASMYQNRGDSDMPKLCEDLLWPYRVYGYVV